MIEIKPANDALECAACYRQHMYQIIGSRFAQPPGNGMIQEASAPRKRALKLHGPQQPLLEWHQHGVHGSQHVSCWNAECQSRLIPWAGFHDSAAAHNEPAWHVHLNMLQWATCKEQRSLLLAAGDHLAIIILTNSS